MWREVLSATLLALMGFSACQPAAPPPPRARADWRIDVLEEAVAWPDRDFGTVVTLTSLYLASGRATDGYTYFRARAQAEPDYGLFLVLEGLFQASRAEQEGLLSRVAYVREAVDKLDRGAALDPDLGAFYRALTLARLPKRFGLAEEAIRSLRALLEDEDSFFYGEEVEPSTRASLIKTSWQGIGQAHDTLGQSAAADVAWDRAGGRPPNFTPTLGTPYSVTARDGFRFSRKWLFTPRSGVTVARGYDFGNIIFVRTEEGLVLIDAGTDPDNAAEALRDYRAAFPDAGAVHTVLLTHAHWDHIGGLAGVVEPNTTVVAQARFAEELAIVNASGLKYRWFFGESTVRDGLAPLYDIEPDVLIDTPTAYDVGGRRFVLHPVAGGETDDALLIEMPDDGIIFVGDIFMPYTGAPQVAEGNPDGLLDVIDLIGELEPELIIHGHPPLTDTFKAEVMAPFGAALAQIRDEVREGIILDQSVVDIVRGHRLPSLLRDHPEAVIPVFVVRQQFIQRLHRLETGYWQADFEGLELFAPEDIGRAIDLVGGGRAEAWSQAVERLNAAGDHQLAWRLGEWGLTRHPHEPRLRAAHFEALNGLRQRNEIFNPFKFIVFSELASVERPPLPGDAL